MLEDLGDNLTSGLIGTSGDYERKSVYHRFGYQEPPRSGRAFYYETSILRMRTLQPGFTLIELLIVIAIIGILATVALPYYQGYMIRARLVEVEHAMTTVESAVSSYHQDNESWPDCLDINAIRTSLGVGLAAISRVSGMSVGTDGAITATVAGIHTMVDGKTIILKPKEKLDHSFSWAWDYGPGFPIQLRQRGNR